jgi:hypothetical protein
MHTVELLEAAVTLATQLGFKVRQEWLDGGGGACELKGQRWLFIDLSLNTAEQLDQVLSALRGEPSAAEFASPIALQRMLQPKRAA